MICCDSGINCITSPLVYKSIRADFLLRTQSVWGVCVRMCVCVCVWWLSREFGLYCEDFFFLLLLWDLCHAADYVKLPQTSTDSSPLFATQIWAHVVHPLVYLPGGCWSQILRRLHCKYIASPFSRAVNTRHKSKHYINDMEGGRVGS